MARRSRMPQDTTIVAPDRRAVPAWVHYLGSLEGLSGAEQIAPIADMAGSETLPQTITKINAILAALRTAGILRT
jgi:hypothetical protein